MASMWIGLSDNDALRKKYEDLLSDPIGHFKAGHRGAIDTTAEELGLTPEKYNDLRVSYMASQIKNDWNNLPLLHRLKPDGIKSEQDAYDVASLLAKSGVADAKKVRERPAEIWKEVAPGFTYEYQHPIYNADGTISFLPKKAVYREPFEFVGLSNQKSDIAADYGSFLKGAAPAIPSASQDIISRQKALYDDLKATLPYIGQRDAYDEKTLIDLQNKNKDALLEAKSLAADGYASLSQIKDYKPLSQYTTDESQAYIKKQIERQQQSLAAQGINWNSGISIDETIGDMASRLAQAGVKSIYDLEPRDVSKDAEQMRVGLVNTRTGEQIPEQYAFATPISNRNGIEGGTWGGTFAGPGSTRYNIDFINGQPVFSAQQQATVKSDLEKIAPAIAGGLVTYLTGGLGAPIAGALGGATSGLLSTGELEGALKGAALGGAGGYVSGLIGGAPISESLPSSFGAGMPFDEVITAAQAAELAAPSLASTISPEVAASNLGLLEGSMGTYVPPVVMEPVLEPSSALTGTIAQPPLTVEDIAGRLTPEATQLMDRGLLGLGESAPMTSAQAAELGRVPLTLETIAQPPVQPALGNLEKSVLLSNQGYGAPEGQQPFQSIFSQGAYQQPYTSPTMFGTGEITGGAEPGDLVSKPWWEGVSSETAASDLSQIEGSMGGGNLDKAVILGNQGYGELSDQTVNQAPITQSPITSLGPSANLKDVVDYLTGGGFAGAVGNELTKALKTLATGATTTPQTSPFGSLASTALGALLANRGQAAPQAPVSAGKAPDILSPIASLLAPKLVQRQPISLL